jgi:integrase
MTADLFGTGGFSSRFDTLIATFDAWATMRAQGQAGTSLRADSIEVYRDMWGNFARWCADRDCDLDRIDAGDLQSFLDSLGRHGDASPRYMRRMLSLIDRVDRFGATHDDRAPNPAIAELRMTVRFRDPDAIGDEPPPEFLTASQAKRVIDLVTTRRSDTLGTWQEVRDRTAVGMLLGAGITPGEARLLTLDQVIVSGGKVQGIPWKLSLPATGVLDPRQTPLATWAGKQLAYWLTVRAQQGIPGDQVFPSTRTGKTWSKPSSINAMQAVLEQAGLPGEGGAFRLRHTFALRQLTRHPEHEVAAWLGLKSSRSMERYRRVLFQPIDIV